MPRQQVEFTFPDEETSASDTTVNVEADSPKDEALEIEGAVNRTDMEKPKKKAAKEADGDFVIEVEDDTPPEDRGRKSSAPPADVTDDELAEYSEKVKKRIQHFNKGYHDERRAKEQALRERQALEQYAKQLLEENKQLKSTTDRSHNALIEQAKQQVALEMEKAKQQYKVAYEAGDAEALANAQEAIANAKIRADKVAGLKPKSLQANENNVQRQVQAPPQRQQPPVVDKKAEAWRDANTWFGADDEMTAYALGYHNKLVKEGVDPRSDTYYEKLDSRMRKLFPEAFFDADEDDGEVVPPKAQAKAPNVVAPATRSTAPKKVTLTQSQVAIAKRLGVPLEQYAKQVAALQRNS